MTDDYLVAREEGVPYMAPTEDTPRDGDLRALVIEALRASDVPAGDRLRVGVSGGSMVVVQGEVESVEVLNEILGIVGDVPGVTDVLDEVQVAGI
jgi:osmotically-inducible protein OsmY